MGYSPECPPTGATGDPDGVLVGAWGIGVPWGPPFDGLELSLTGIRGIMGPPRGPAIEGDLDSGSELGHSRGRWGGPVGGLPVVFATGIPRKGKGETKLDHSLATVYIE